MPVVLALAMLLPMTSRLRLAAFNPESPVSNDMFFLWMRGDGYVQRMALMAL